MSMKAVFGEPKKLSKAIVVTFQNGELSKNEIKKLNAQMEGGSIKDLIISDKNGNNFKPCDNLNLDSSNFLVIRNKKTNKVKIIEIENVSLMNSIYFGSTEEKKRESGKNVVDKMFAGKKAVRRIDQREKLKFDPAFVQEDLKASVAEVDVGDILQSSTLADNESMCLIIPECNRDANSPSDVYKLTSIISDAELESFTAMAEEVLQGEDSIIKLSKFINSCLTSVKKSNDNITTKVCALLYADCILHFLKINTKVLKSKISSVCPDEVIQEKITEEFCVKTDKALTRPLSMRDKAICFCITIGLLCCDFAINLQPLAEDCGHGTQKLAQLCRTVGAVPRGKGEHIYILKCPLPPLPTARKAKGRR